MRIIYIVFFISSMIFSSSGFSIKEKSALESIIEFNIGEISIEYKE